ncbi:MAG: outer membrane beta-barrel protein [Bradymonadia bacterium]
MSLLHHTVTPGPRSALKLLALGLAMLVAPTLVGVSGQAAAGNHFIAELTGGVSTPTGLDAEAESGSLWGATLGVGGRLPGTRPAWYLVTRLSWADMTQYGPNRMGRPVVDRSQADLALGVRGYFPFTPRLRLMTEVAMGQVFETSQVTFKGQEDFPAQFSTDRFGLFTEAGLQYRMTNHFSLGGRVGMVWMPSPEEPDLAAQAASIPGSQNSQGRWSAGLTTTFHF